MRGAGPVSCPLAFCLAVALLWNFSPAPAAAGDAGSIFWTVNVPPNMVDARIYGARVNGAIFTACPPGSTGCTSQPTSDWSGSNVLTGTITGVRGDSLTFSGTRDEFEPFLRANADEIIRILFPSDPESSIKGVPGGAGVALFNFDTLVLGPVSPKPSDLAALKKKRSSREFTPAEGEPPFQAFSLIEGESYDIHGTSGANYKFTPGFAFNIGPLELSTFAPFVYTELSDSIHTNAYTFGLNFSAKYDIDIIEERWTVSPLVGAFANAFLFTSDNIDIAGYIRYGGYVGLATQAALGPTFLTGGVLYSVSTISIPSGLVPSGFQPLADALSSRPVDQQITLGAKAGLRLGELGVTWLQDFVFSLGATYVQTIGSTSVESGLRSFTQGQASLMYAYRGFGLEVGYKHIFGASNLTSNAGFLNMTYQF